MSARAKRKQYRVLCANGHAIEVSMPPRGLWVVDLHGCGPHRVEKWDGEKWTSETPQ